MGIGWGSGPSGGVPGRVRRAGRVALRVGLLGIVLGGLLLNGAPVPAAAQAPVRVVATLPPVADLMARLGGDRVSVSSLLPAGASPHAYEPRPSDVRRVAEADLVVAVGAGLDGWLQPLLEVAGSAARLELAGTTRLLPAGEEHEVHGGDGEDGRHEAEHPHDHGPWDPHIWLDPLRVRDDLAPALAQSLAARDPAGGEAYRRNLAALQEELTRLDREIRSLLEPHAGTRFVAVHSAWRYFAVRYGLEQVASIQEFPGREPGPAWVAAVIRLAREEEVRLVVTEAQFDPRLAEQIARESGTAVVLLDPLGGPGVKGMESYPALMRANACRIAGALAGEGGCADAAAPAGWR